jgi:hypothetical protein
VREYNVDGGNSGTVNRPAVQVVGSCYVERICLLPRIEYLFISSNIACISPVVLVGIPRSGWSIS